MVIRTRCEKVMKIFSENNLKIQEHKSDIADLRREADKNGKKQEIIFGGMRLIRDEAGGLGVSMDPRKY